MSLSRLQTLPRVFSALSQSLNPRSSVQRLVSTWGTKFEVEIVRYSSTFGDRNPEFQDFKDKFRKDKVMTIPNGLCLLRQVFIIALTPVIGYLVVHSQFMPACVLFTVAGITDLLDGLIARNFESQKSLLGSVLDPVADKLLVSTLFVTLTYVELIPVLLTAVVLLRDILLIIGGFIRRYQILEPPVTFKRFFDPAVSSVQVFPTFTSKVNTALQLSLVTFSLASPVFDFVNHPLLSVLGVVTFGTTVISGLQYAGGKAMMRVDNNKIR